MNEELFSARLSSLRIKKGVSARDMSLSIGQNPGYINNIENGKSLPSMNCFFFICDYLNITPMDFFDYDSSHPSELKQIFNNLKKLNEQQLFAIDILIKELTNNNNLSHK
ncbi:MAG: helix-turn-helix domain-containing protein [Lachnospiraceae bacterium]